MRNSVALVICLAVLCACSALSREPATLTPTETQSATPTTLPTTTPAKTATPDVTITPSSTPTPRVTPTPSSTATATATFAPTPTPSITPLPVVDAVFDNWDMKEIPANIKDGIANAMVAFLNYNNRQTIANIATAQPNTGIQTLYLVSPSNPGRRIAILETASNIQLEVFMAQSGTALAYVKRDSDFRRNGLYIMDVSTGFTARVLPGNNPLVQRGFYVAPDWSPDGSQLALALATGYAIDIFLYAKDGSGRKNLTNAGSYDWWPRWSPDGRYLSFVSDRSQCPSWIPGDEGFCDAAAMSPPTSGQVYVIAIETGEVRKIADVPVSEPPYWINEQLLAFASGDPLDLLNPQRRLWQANIETGQVHQIQLTSAGDQASYLSETWSPDGKLLLLQVADNGNRLVLIRADGELLRQDSELEFPRYGVSADWSPDGQRIAIGGTAGQCPYGIRVKAGTYRNVATGHPPPSMCDPLFSPDSQHIAFTGVNPRVDGRNDVYISNYNGFGSNNITASLRGQVELLGWVGGRP